MTQMRLNAPIFKTNRIFFLLIVFFVYSCSAPKKEICYDVAGRDCSDIPYITEFDDWDSCYLRGSSFMECGCFDLAIKEFNKAINQRPDDTKNARTYGMHFLGIFPNIELHRIGYFPHRELGIIHYKTGQTEKAIEELNRSLKDNPSSRAKFYLNKARKKLIEENDLDLSDPRLKISFPLSSKYTTKEFTLTINGEAEDDQFVSGLSINGDPVFIELSSKNIPFSKKISLKRGLNIIKIVANDLVGKTDEEILKIVVDRTGPAINLSYSSMEYISSKKILIHGVIFDESGVEKFSINDSAVDIKNGEIAEFSHSIDIIEGLDKLTFFARDILGNETTSVIEIPLRNPSGRRPKSYSSREKINNENLKSKQQNFIRVASLDNILYPLLSSQNKNYCSNEDVKEINDSLSDPLIFFKPLPEETIDSHICMEVRIQYIIDISAFRIRLNGKPILGKLYDSGLISKLINLLKKEKEKSLIIAEIIELGTGKNEIIIEIKNEAGEYKKEVFHITKKEEKLLQRKYRLCIAVCPVEDLSRQKCSPTLLIGSYKNLEGAFVEQKRFQIVEREKIKEILRELKLGISDLVENKKKRKKVKEKIRTADKFFFSYIKIYGTDTVEWGGKIVDTDTSEINFHIKGKDIYLEGDLDEIIPKAADILAMKVRENYPLCKGKILEKKRKKIKVNIGKKEKIEEDTELIVYRENEPDPLIFGIANIERVFYDESWAKLLYNDDNNYNNIKVGDLVITR